VPRGVEVRVLSWAPNNPAANSGLFCPLPAWLAGSLFLDRACHRRNMIVDEIVDEIGDHHRQRAEQRARRRRICQRDAPSTNAVSSSSCSFTTIDRRIAGCFPFGLKVGKLCLIFDTQGNVTSPQALWMVREAEATRAIATSCAVHQRGLQGMDLQCPKLPGHCHADAIKRVH
jgi:hypothetical protein